jgi:hypothetical protein
MARVRRSRTCREETYHPPTASPHHDVQTFPHIETQEPTLATNSATKRTAAKAPARAAAGNGQTPPKGRAPRSTAQVKKRQTTPAVPDSADPRSDRALEQVAQAMDQVRGMGQAVERAPARIGETANESDIVNELAGGGVAFGDFVKQVGLGVAAAQTELDKTLVATAKALSEVEINTVAVFEQQIKDDDGTMDRGEYHIQKLPLTNYLMPTAYNFSRVYLEADMNVQEFNSRSGFDIQRRAFSAGASISGSAGTMGWGVSGSAHVGYGSSGTTSDAAFGSDLAAGRLHMEATLEPRKDIELPRPYVLQKGPRLQLIVGARKQMHEGGDEKKPVIGQLVELTAVLQTSNGGPNTDKPLSVNVSEPSINYDTTGKTGSDGSMKITLTRQGAVFDPTNPVRAVVRVSFGLVAQAVGIIL